MCVKDLADQKQEIEKMKSWRESGGSASSSVATSSAKAGPGHADMKSSNETKHTGHEGMMKGDMMGPRMMKKMKEKEDHLRQSTGADFEKDYLKIMSEHHQSAIAMARPCMAKAQQAELKQLCSDIVTNQTEARKQMMSWRAQWYGGSQSSSK